MDNDTSYNSNVSRYPSMYLGREVLYLTCIGHKQDMRAMEGRQLRKVQGAVTALKMTTVHFCSISLKMEFSNNIVVNSHLT